MTYKPQIDDYVKWKNHEGWVYFFDYEYITIEIGVTEKDENNIKHCPIHKKTHCLLLCYHSQWKELEYLTNRRNSEDEYKSQQYRYSDP